MAIYLVAYDLNLSGKRYEELTDKIREIADGYFHELESAWLIGHAGPSGAVMDALSPFLDADDEMLVAIMGTGDASWAGFDEKGDSWLQEALS